MTDLLDPKLDYIFKTIFGTDDKKDVLKSFLNALFKGRPNIEDLSLENTDIAKIIETNKASRVDVRATTDNGTQLDIEIQCNNTGEIPQRAFHYLANMVPMAVHSGQSYKGHHVIGIWILGENVTNRRNAISEAYMTFQPNPPDPYQIMLDSARIIFIELPNFNPTSADDKDLLTAWLSFLKNPIFLDESFLTIKEVRVAMDTLKYISADDEVRAIADLRQKTINDYNSQMTVAQEEGIAIGEARGVAIGKEEGIAIGIRETALSMLKAGIPLETISQCTKLSVKEISSLQKQTQS
jgi:predicted transposase/invertase (TIGR01784 family)